MPRPAGAPPRTDGAELRALCLARIDPATVATMAPDRPLRPTVEAARSHEVATEQRIAAERPASSGRSPRDLVDDMVGLGPLEPLLADDAVTDIMVNGPTRSIVERRGKLERADVRFRDNAALRTSPRRSSPRSAGASTKRSPMVDARLPDGSRVNIIFPPLALDGPCISIRKFSKKKLDFDAMVANSAACPRRGAAAGDRRALPAQHPDLRRHRLRQDHAAERAQPA